MRRTTTVIERRNGWLGFFCGGMCVVLFVAGIGDLKGCQTIAGAGRDIQTIADGIGREMGKQYREESK